MEINLKYFSEKVAEIELFLSQPNAYAAPDFAEKSRELAEYQKVLDLAKEIDKTKQQLADAEDLLKSGTSHPDLQDLDPAEAEQLLALAQSDATALTAKLEQQRADLDELLIPRDPQDAKPVILEIRAGAGGDEAALFAGELARMYLHYAEKHGLKSELISKHENDSGGTKEAILRFTGDQPYGQLKFEGGVHRVQRVPVTESQGRVHTSTATVAALPEAEETELEINPDDLRIDIYRSGGHGGQGVNTTDSAVRITHLPTGTVVTMQDERSQQQNRVKAMSILRSRLLQMQQAADRQAASDTRKSLIGTGDRSEKIRTYNFPQDRVTDHRIHYSRSNINAVMNGDIDDIINELQKHEREEQK